MRVSRPSVVAASAPQVPPENHAKPRTTRVSACFKARRQAYGFPISVMEREASMSHTPKPPRAPLHGLDNGLRRRMGRTGVRQGSARQRDIRRHRRQALHAVRQQQDGGRILGKATYRDDGRGPAHSDLETSPKPQVNAGLGCVITGSTSHQTAQCCANKRSARTKPIDFDADGIAMIASNTTIARMQLRTGRRAKAVCAKGPTPSALSARCSRRRSPTRFRSPSAPDRRPDRRPPRQCRPDGRCPPADAVRPKKPWPRHVSSRLP